MSTGAGTVTAAPTGAAPTGAAPTGAAPTGMAADELDEFRRATRAALSKAPRPRDVAEPSGQQESAAWEKGARKALGSLGAFGLLVDEANGGSAAGFVAMTVVLQEVGRAGVGRWFSSSAVAAARLLADEADTVLGHRLLPDLASGARVVTVAVTGPSGRYDLAGIAVTATTEGEGNGDGAVLTGVADFVPALADADCVVVAARLADGPVGGGPVGGGPVGGGGVGLFVVDRTDDGVVYGPGDRFGLNGLASLRLDGVRVPAARVLRRGLDADRLADLVAAGAVAVSAEMVGSAARVLELTVAYAGDRQQFGSPIGAFGTVQHHCVQMRTDVQTARAVTNRAAAAFDVAALDVDSLGAPNPDALWLASAAKAWTARATRRVVGRAHRVHGAIGFSAEHELPRHTAGQRDSWALWGDPRFHAGRIASGL